MKKPFYKTARVTWLDACNYGDEASIEWFQANAHLKEYSTVGQIIRKDRKELVLAGDISKRGTGRDVNVIHRGSIVKIEYWDGGDGKEKIK